MRVRSGELARLAGVTVRALRHYHQVGVLAEPARHRNGYREYDVHALIRVLRIKRLASLGIPLERMAGLLDSGVGRDSGTAASELLAELDAEFAAQIDRLTTQRETIARLRASDAAPDVPPELAPFLSAFPFELSPDLAKFDRDQSVLLAHLAGEESLPQIVRLYERLSEPDLSAVVLDIYARFGQIGAHSTEQEISDLVECAAGAFAPVAASVAASESTIDLSETEHIFSEHSTSLLNEQQRRALEELKVRLYESSGPGAADGPGEI